MQIDSSPVPHSLAQVLWLVLASSLGWGGAEFRAWLARRRREPTELAKINAETRQIHTTADLDVWREFQLVVEKAEKQREEWWQREDQLRSQVIFWRNKSEEFDGRLADAQEAIWKMQSEVQTYELQIAQMKAALVLADTNYDNTRNKKVEPLPD